MFPIGPPIDLLATEYTQTSSGNTYPAVQYTVLTMPIGNAAGCVGECAEDVTAYMRFLGGDDGGSGLIDSGDGDSGNGDSGDGDSGNGDSGNGDSGNGDSGDDGNPAGQLPNTSVQVPSRVEAEDFVRFSDTDEINRGGAGPDTAVDVEPTGDTEGNLNVGFIEAGEWLEYDVHSENDVTVNISLRVATTQNNREVALVVDGELMDSLTVPNTGDFQDYSRVTFAGIPLTADTNHVIRLEFIQGPFNLNFLDFAALVPITIEVPVGRSVNSNEAISSPLSRLTNVEFVRSIRSALELPDNSPNIEAALPMLAAESVVAGLANDSNAQSFSTSVINGYLAVAEAAADDFIGDANSSDEIEEMMGCGNVNAATCFREFARGLVPVVFGVPFENDAQFFGTFLTDIEGFVEDAGFNSGSFAATRFRLRAFMSYLFLTPEFLLFVEEPPASGNSRQLSSVEIAKRMSYFLTGTLPDAELREAALNDDLSDPAIRIEQANRLLNDDSIDELFAEFFIGWLGVSTASDGVQQADVNSLRDFLADWFGNNEPFSGLYSGNFNVLTSDGLDTSMNVGVLGSRAFVASHTNAPVPGFINRGQFVTEQLLCGNLPADIPVEAFEEAQTVSETPRELFHELRTMPCATCHQVFDNYGGLFQQFDDQNILFDPSLRPYGDNLDLLPIGDVGGEHSSLEDLALTLGFSATAARCNSELLYRHSVRRGIDVDGADEEAIDDMFNTWINSGDTSMRSLLLTLIASDQFITFFD